MFLEENRLESFKKWVFDDDQPCNAAKMAEAGFYSTATKSDPDLVQCFLCSKPLDGWDAKDNPWEEHLSHSKTCTFAKLKLPEEELTCVQFAAIRKEQLQNVYKKHFADLIQDRKDAWDEFCASIEEVAKMK